MAINEPPGSPDPTRGSGGEKVTTAAAPDVEAPAGALDSEPAGSDVPDPGGGGCMKYGWSCLPVLTAVIAVPAGLLY